MSFLQKYMFEVKSMERWGSAPGQEPNGSRCQYVHKVETSCTVVVVLCLKSFMGFFFYFPGFFCLWLFLFFSSFTYLPLSLLKQLKHRIAEDRNKMKQGSGAYMFLVLFNHFLMCCNNRHSPLQPWPSDIVTYLTLLKTPWGIKRQQGWMKISFLTF